MILNRFLFLGLLACLLWSCGKDDDAPANRLQLGSDYNLNVGSGKLIHGANYPGGYFRVYAEFRLEPSPETPRDSNYLVFTFAIPVSAPGLEPIDYPVFHPLSDVNRDLQSGEVNCSIIIGESYDQRSEGNHINVRYYALRNGTVRVRRSDERYTIDFEGDAVWRNDPTLYPVKFYYSGVLSHAD